MEGPCASTYYGGLHREMGEILSNRSLLEFRLSLDFKELNLNKLMILWQAAKFRKGSARLSFSAMMDKPTRGEGHEDHSCHEDQGREKLKGKRNHPRGVALTSASATDVILEEISLCSSKRGKWGRTVP